MNRCDTCSKANQDCPIYPRGATSCISYRPLPVRAYTDAEKVEILEAALKDIVREDWNATDDGIEQGQFGSMAGYALERTTPDLSRNDEPKPLRGGQKITVA